MADGLEEPQVPSGLDAGHAFMNAFALMSNVNAKKRALENQIAKMQIGEQIAQDRDARERDKMNLDYGFKMADMNRKMDVSNMTSVYHDIMAQNAVNRLQWQMGKDVAENENVGKYRDKLTSISTQYPIDSQAWKLAVSAANTEFSSLGKAGEPVWRDFNTNAENARKTAHTNAQDSLKTFNESLPMAAKGGSSFSRQDFFHPDSTWQTGKDEYGNKTRFLPRTFVPAQPGNPQSPMIKRTLSRKEEMEILKSGGKVNYDTMTDENYNLLKGAHKNILGMTGGNNLSDLPGTYDSSKSFDPAPADPSQRVSGTTYQTPKGPHTWDGSQWQVPQ